MRTLIIIATFILFLSATNSFAELKTIDVSFQWDISSTTGVEGFKVYCGKTRGGPYTGIDITGGNPLDIPTGNITDMSNIEYTISVTLDTATEKNCYCVIKSYNTNGEESGSSNEITLVPALIETQTSETTLSLKSARNLSITDTNYLENIVANKDYIFDEPVIFASGRFSSSYEEFVVIGKTTGKVWVIPQDSSTFVGSFLPKQEWLVSVDMQNIDDIIALNFNKADETGGDRAKDDIAVIDYTNGIVKVFLNNGSSFNSTSILNGGFGTFSGNNIFQKSLAGDFTGNGYEDLALYAPSTKNLVVWESDGTTWRNRGVWCQGGSSDAYPEAIDYNGDKKVDLMFFNFTGGAFSAFKSTGTSFVNEVVQYFTAGAFDYVLVKDFDIFNNKKIEFGIHAQHSTGNFVVFKYEPNGSGDTAPFKSEKIWLNTSYDLY